MIIILWPAKEWRTKERWCHISRPSLMWAVHHRHDHHDHLHLHHRHHDHHQKIFIFFDKMIIVMIVKLPIFTKIWLTQVGTDSEGEIDEIFFIWPTTLVRRISFNIFFKKTFFFAGAQDRQREPVLQHERERFLEKALRDCRSSWRGDRANWKFNPGDFSETSTTMIKRFSPRLGPLTFPTRCCGVTVSSTYSTSSIPSPSTKLTTLHSTQFIGGKHSLNFNRAPVSGLRCRQRARRQKIVVRSRTRSWKDWRWGWEVRRRCWEAPRRCSAPQEAWGDQLLVRANCFRFLKPPHAGEKLELVCVFAFSETFHLQGKNNSDEERHKGAELCWDPSHRLTLGHWDNLGSPEKTWQGRENLENPENRDRIMMRTPGTQFSKDRLWHKFKCSKFNFTLSWNWNVPLLPSHLWTK